MASLLSMFKEKVAAAAAATAASKKRPRTPEVVDPDDSAADEIELDGVKDEERSADEDGDTSDEDFVEDGEVSSPDVSSEPETSASDTAEDASETSKRIRSSEKQRIRDAASAKRLLKKLSRVAEGGTDKKKKKKKKKTEKEKEKKKKKAPKEMSAFALKALEARRAAKIVKGVTAPDELRGDIVVDLTEKKKKKIVIDDDGDHEAEVKKPTTRLAPRLWIEVAPCSTAVRYSIDLKATASYRWGTRDWSAIRSFAIAIDTMKLADDPAHDSLFAKLPPGDAIDIHLPGARVLPFVHLQVPGFPGSVMQMPFKDVDKLLETTELSELAKAAITVFRKAMALPDRVPPPPVVAAPLPTVPPLLTLKSVPPPPPTTTKTKTKVATLPSNDAFANGAGDHENFAPPRAETKAPEPPVEGLSLTPSPPPAVVVATSSLTIDDVVNHYRGATGIREPLAMARDHMRSKWYETLPTDVLVGSPEKVKQFAHRIKMMLVPNSNMKDFQSFTKKSKEELAPISADHRKTVLVRIIQPLSTLLLCVNTLTRNKLLAMARIHDATTTEKLDIDIATLNLNWVNSTRPFLKQYCERDAVNLKRVVHDYLRDIKSHCGSGYMSFINPEVSSPNVLEYHLELRLAALLYIFADGLSVVLAPSLEQHEAAALAAIKRDQGMVKF